jgi:hypothetical protein
MPATLFKNLILRRTVFVIFFFEFNFLLLLKVKIVFSATRKSVTPIFIGSLKVPKRETFDRSDFPDFYTIKSSWVGDLVVKILTYYFNF